MNEDHVYDPLLPGYIRIVEIEPSDDPKSPLQCNLIYVKVDSDFCAYEALSYTWGTPIFSQSVVVHGNSILWITQNLADAFYQFRLPDRKRRLWADAICIDQKNEHEKNVQIPLMGQIYRNAERVVVWLGRENGGEESLDLLNRSRKTITDINGLPERGESTKIVSSAVSALENVLSLQWFTRRWVIQEVVLNSEVILFSGSVSVSWTRLVAWTCTLSRHLRQKETAVAIMNISKLWLSRSLGHDEFHSGVLRNLDIFQKFECREPSDRIFAIASLCDDVQLISVEDDQKDAQSLEMAPFASGKQPKMLVRTDYSTEIKALFTAFATEAVRCGHLLPIISAVEKGRRNTTWPSWVPDWRIEAHNHSTYCPPDDIPMSTTLLYSNEAEIGIQLTTLSRNFVFLEPNFRIRWTGSILDIGYQKGDYLKLASWIAESVMNFCRPYDVAYCHEYEEAVGEDFELEKYLEIIEYSWWQFTRTVFDDLIRHPEDHELKRLYENVHSIYIAPVDDEEDSVSNEDDLIYSEDEAVSTDTGPETFEQTMLARRTSQEESTINEEDQESGSMADQYGLDWGETAASTLIQSLSLLYFLGHSPTLSNELRNWVPVAELVEHILMRYAASGCRLFVSEADYGFDLPIILFGIGPSTIQHSDHIITPFFWPSPSEGRFEFDPTESGVIFRPIQTESNIIYECVGCCYLTKTSRILHKKEGTYEVKDYLELPLR
ncbi:heterokaryon incompatibility protein-domain-containing protein [Tricladium varicosporioides]|nr:heterokaryon incompatibility protein-domain-containing protein [Hymenoscyphus varicosporioides]